MFPLPVVLVRLGLRPAILRQLHIHETEVIRRSLLLPDPHNVHLLRRSGAQLVILRRIHAPLHIHVILAVLRTAGEPAARHLETAHRLPVIALQHLAITAQRLAIEVQNLLRRILARVTGRNQPEVRIAQSESHVHGRVVVRLHQLRPGIHRQSHLRRGHIAVRMYLESAARLLCMPLRPCQHQQPHATQRNKPGPATPKAHRNPPVRTQHSTNQVRLRFRTPVDLACSPASHPQPPRIIDSGAPSETMNPAIFLTRCAAALLLSAVVVSAQQPQQIPPPEPPQPLPGSNPDEPTLRVTTQEVLVPTLVEAHDGTILYGLKPDDFILTDNGAPQKLRVQEELDTAPVALVVAVEQGRMSALEFEKFAHLGPLLDSFLSNPRSQGAVIGFDSVPHLVHDYTHSTEDLGQSLKTLEPGDGGNAILDTVNYAVTLLETQPKSYRRVLLLISEPRDHGSKHTKITGLIRKIGQSDVLVLTVSFSPFTAQFLHDVKDNGESRTLNMMGALLALVQALKTNVSKEIATMSGGEYTTFISDKKFQQRVQDAAKHARNRYLLTFSPSDPTPGLHSIQVHLAQDYSARVTARANYWVGPEANIGGTE
ncbi:VWA domain-containing protein [Acidobacteria bacterium AB60]|nr:VWA domain-containing protein [Acidobacteria bacterium AB60]